MEVVCPAAVPTNHAHAASAATPRLAPMRARAAIATRAFRDGERASERASEVSICGAQPPFLAPSLAPRS